MNFATAKKIIEKLEKETKSTNDDDDDFDNDDDDDDDDNEGDDDDDSDGDGDGEPTFMWRKADSARRVTEPTFCFFSKRFTTFCKEM